MSPLIWLRYVPKDKPSAQSFDVDGVRVGMAGSNHNRVQLVNVNLDTAGTIMCEVSTINGTRYILDHHVLGEY